MVEATLVPPHDIGPPHPDCPRRLFRLFTDLIEADVHEELARELVDRVRPATRPTTLHSTSRR